MATGSILTATDLELGIRCSCPARVKKSGGGTIPARRLLDYVRLLPDADVQVKIQENHWASLVCGRSRTRIAGMSRESFPELPQMPALLAEIPDRDSGVDDRQDDLRHLDGRIAVYAERRLAGAAQGRSGDGGDRWASAGDGRELGRASGHRRQRIARCLPKKAMQELQKLAGDADPAAMVKFSGDDNHLFFQLGDRLLLSRKLTGNFPDYERVLPKEQPQLGDARARGVSRRDRTRGAVFR